MVEKAQARICQKQSFHVSVRAAPAKWKSHIPKNRAPPELKNRTLLNPGHH
jgi:hypothetical protein